LPDFIFDSRARWLEFLDHGRLCYPNSVTATGLGDLTPPQIASFLRLLCITPEYLSSLAAHMAVIWAAEYIEATHSASRRAGSGKQR
jgi:hypothetical protein